MVYAICERRGMQAVNIAFNNNNNNNNNGYF